LDQLLRHNVPYLDRNGKCAFAKRLGLFCALEPGLSLDSDLPPFSHHLWSLRSCESATLFVSTWCIYLASHLMKEESKC